MNICKIIISEKKKIREKIFLKKKEKDFFKMKKFKKEQ